MKKLFLTLALVLGFMSASAGEITLTATEICGFTATTNLPASNTVNGITFAYSKSSGQTAPAYNQSGDIRIYAKNTLTISVPTGATLDKIVFNISAQGKKRLPPVTANVGTVEPQTVGAATVTWTGSDASVVLTAGDKADYGTEGASKAGQFAWSSVTITYTGSLEGGDEPNPPTPPTPTYKEVNSVRDIIALEDGALFETTFSMTIAYAYYNNVYACDAAGDFIQLYGSYGLKTNDVVPAGLKGKYTLYSKNTPELTDLTLPEGVSNTGDFTPAVVDAADVTIDLVNSVVMVENVTIAEATPAAAANFYGTANGTELTFFNKYGVESKKPGVYNVTFVVTIYKNAPSLYVIKMDEAINEVGSIAEILALDTDTQISTTFPLTVAFGQNGDAYVFDEAGDYILVTGAEGLFAGDAIPAGLVGKYSLEGEVPQIAATTVPTATEGSYTPEVEDAANVTVEMVNHVFIINDVRFAEDTPSSNEANFTGTCGDIEFAFANKYSIEGVPAGLYNVTVAVSILDNAPLLYVISYQEADGNVRNADDIAAFIGNCTEESFPSVAINNPVVALYQNGDYLYIKDESGYLLVYGDTKQTYTNGMVIPAGIAGLAENAGGVYQLAEPMADTFQAGEAGEIVMPEYIDYSEIATTAVNTYVYLNSLTFNQDLEGEWTLLAGGVVLPMENKFDIEFIEGGVATVSGFIGLNEGKAVFYPISVEMDAPVPTPTFSVKAGNVAEGTVVEIECADADATIYYNTDGSNTYRKIYTEPIVITENVTIKAIAINHGERSLTARATYTVDGSEGIEAIDADDATVEYYNLQGVRVANPENGLFIRRQGGKAVKVIVK